MIGLMKGLALAFALVASVALCANAQGVTSDKFEQRLKSYDSATVEAARSYIRVANLKEMMQQSIPALRGALTAQVKAKNPSLNDEQVNAFFEAFLQTALVDSSTLIEQATILIMLEILTKDEIVALNQFYSSLTGRDILKKMPQFLGRMPEVMQAMQQVVFPRALEAAQGKLKQRGVDVRI